MELNIIYILKIIFESINTICKIKYLMAYNIVIYTNGLANK